MEENRSSRLKVYFSGITIEFCGNGWWEVDRSDGGLGRRLGFCKWPKEEEEEEEMCKLGLSNRSGRVGFVFGSKLNGLKTPRPEPDLFNKRVEKSNLKPFNI